MWHVSSRSGVETLRTAIHLLLTYSLTAHGPGACVRVCSSTEDDGVDECAELLFIVEAVAERAEARGRHHATRVLRRRREIRLHELLSVLQYTL